MFTPGEAKLYLKGNVERWRILEDYLDVLAIRIVSAWNSKGASELESAIRLHKRARDEGLLAEE